MTMASLLRQHLAGLRAVLVLTVVLGLGYPLLMTGVAQLVFNRQANGSLVSAGGVTVGSSLLGQSFLDPKGNPLPQWFQPRPSAAGKTGYDPMSSGASNLGPSSSTLVELIRTRRAQVAAFNGVPREAVPPDAVTASGSGLDPDISPQYAYLQVDRVARARGLDPAAVRRVVTLQIQRRSIGVLGDPRVDVLELNLALQRLGR